MLTCGSIAMELATPLTPWTSAATRSAAERWNCQVVVPVSVTHPCRTVALTRPAGMALSHLSASATAWATTASETVDLVAATSRSLAIACTPTRRRAALGQPLLAERRDEALQRHDAIHHRHANLCRIDARFALERGEDLLLEVGDPSSWGTSRERPADAPDSAIAGEIQTVGPRGQGRCHARSRRNRRRRSADRRISGRSPGATIARRRSGGRILRLTDAVLTEAQAPQHA